MAPDRLPATLSLRKLRHHERDVLGLFFPYDQALLDQVKTLPDGKNSTTWRGWSVPYTELHQPSQPLRGSRASR